MKYSVLVSGVVVAIATVSGVASGQNSVFTESPFGCQEKKALQVFEPWVDPKNQYFHNEFEDIHLCSLRDQISKKFQFYAQKKVKTDRALLVQFNVFFSLLARQQWLTDSGTIVFNKYMQQGLKKIYPMADTDVAGFLKMLKQYGLATEDINKIEVKKHFQKVIDKYNAFADFLCASSTENFEASARFALANRFFEFCFSSDTWPIFKKMLKTPADHPLIRLLHSVVWYNMAGDGWKNWHASTLKALKSEYDTGKEVVYVAGGTDIYNLLKHGIRRIRVIDPLLPTQPRYYIPEWSWFVRDETAHAGVGDTLTFNFGKEKLVMKRTNYQESPGIMRVKDLENKPLAIQESVTTWTLYDAKNQSCGTVIFDRRFACQNDFMPSDDKALLMSFNELYYVVTVGEDNWGIDLEPVRDIKLYVKQLRNPVNKAVMAHMHETDGSNFQFIKLGTAVCEP